MNARALSAIALMVAAIALPGLGAGIEDIQGAGSGAPAYSADCIGSIAAALRQRGAHHDGVHKPGLRVVPSATAERIMKHGIRRGRLEVSSLVSPPSNYSVYQFADRSQPKAIEVCPLDQTYVVFIQGGFNGSAPVVYGPIR